MLYFLVKMNPDRDNSRAKILQIIVDIGYRIVLKPFDVS